MPRPLQLKHPKPRHRCKWQVPTPRKRLQLLCVRQPLPPLPQVRTKNCYGYWRMLALHSALVHAVLNDEAIEYKKGLVNIPLISLLAITSGGSAGPEGPVLPIGGCIGG